jgi:F-type H+-transporting ATPase subunit b
MDETLRQIGELLLGAVPTVIFFLLLFGLYTVFVHRPLTRVLAERRARTQGAIEKAQADVAAAEERAAEYEQKLRDARLKLFKALEARRPKLRSCGRRQLQMPGTGPSPDGRCYASRD